MQVCVIDLETTGLTPTVHGITEFGAVWIDLFKPGETKQFYKWLNPEGYVWSNYCLKLHRRWIETVTNRQQKDGSFFAVPGQPAILDNIAALNAEFKTWLHTSCGVEPKDTDGNFDRFVGAGKNFGSFDLQFLQANKFLDCFKHRSLDPGGLYTVKGDKVPPQLADCKARAIAQGCRYFESADVMHEALADAMDVAKLLWWAFAPEGSKTTP